MVKPVTDSRQLTRLKLAGYKSIQPYDLEFGSLNVLIGANGAGKSNFIGFFRLIQQLIEGNLQRHVSQQGGPDALLYYGRKTTDRLHAELYFREHSYWLTLEPTVDNRLMFADESSWWNITGPGFTGSGHFESMCRQSPNPVIDRYVIPAVRDWHVYHFHDTGEEARVKQRHLVNDNAYLWPNARNLAAYLYLLQKKADKHYRRIVQTVRMVAPFFGDFRLRPCPDNEDFIELEWVESEQDSRFKAHMLSDGTLRFICLATVLLQPAEYRPATIIVDEPELGLHPYAITILASLIESAAQESQIIVSTQSVELVNGFDAEDLVVVDRVQGKSSFRRPDARELADWLSEYSLGELWKKNLLGGRPAR